MERPALQRLLADIRSGLIDTVVVYKVDRLTRSLSDFARLVEHFDEHEVSFVSVTQSFNTTTSMGRLTLNVLLSFAQFEREVTGERIRDKIAASKQKGMRMGGPVPLGYEVRDKKLVIHPDEADQVQLIFRRYLELGCLTKLARSLREEGVRTKVSRRRDGTLRGGISFTKGALAYLLRNRVYVGEVIHKGRYYPGEHDPIMPQAAFDAVQQELTAKARNTGTHRIAGSLLTGRIFDDRGNRMTPTTTKKGGARYRYYTSCVLAQGRKEEAGSMARVPAAEIEAHVVQVIRSSAQKGRVLLNGAGEIDDGCLIEQALDRVVIRKGAVEIWGVAQRGRRSAATRYLAVDTGAEPAQARDHSASRCDRRASPDPGRDAGAPRRGDCEGAAVAGRTDDRQHDRHRSRSRDGKGAASDRCG